MWAGGCPRKYVTGALAEEWKSQHLSIADNIKEDAAPEKELSGHGSEKHRRIMSRFLEMRISPFTIEKLEEEMQKVMMNMPAESQ